MYLSIPLNLQYVLYVILGGIGGQAHRASKVGKNFVLGLAPNSFYQIFLYLSLIPFLSIIYSLRDTITDVPEPQRADAQKASDNCRVAIILLTVKILFDLDFAYIGVNA